MPRVLHQGRSSFGPAAGMEIQDALLKSAEDLVRILRSIRGTAPSLLDAALDEIEDEMAALQIP